MSNLLNNCSALILMLCSCGLLILMIYGVLCIILGYGTLCLGDCYIEGFGGK